MFRAHRTGNKNHSRKSNVLVFLKINANFLKYNICIYMYRVIYKIVLQLKMFLKIENYRLVSCKPEFRPY
jgi:hypothetical protein